MSCRFNPKEFPREILWKMIFQNSIQGKRLTGENVCKLPVFMEAVVFSQWKGSLEENQKYRDVAPKRET